MSKGLKSCPFCFSERCTVFGGLARKVSCNDCEAEGPAKATKDEAIAAWNRRAPAQPEPVECNACDGTGRVDSPEQCARCGSVGCSTDECAACSGTGQVAAMSQPEPAAPTVVEPPLGEGEADLTVAYLAGFHEGKRAATPPRAALTDEQIRNLWFAAKPTEDGRPASWNFARAIEAAHGIGGPRNE